MSVLLLDRPFDPAAELAAFRAPGAGAVVTFTGIARPDGGMTHLEIEHWPGHAEEAIAAMVADATARFGLLAARVVHRHGAVAAGEPIMMVLAAAPHRRAAFDGADLLMDFLKSRAPFWKREHRPGGAAWVEGRDADEAALARWDRAKSPQSPGPR